MTKLVETLAEIRKKTAQARGEGRSIGFVPTMGALHDGHTALLHQCRRESNLAVASIFVNPTQFGPGEDFNRYPRTLPEDLERCLQAGIDLVFAPSPAELYPNGLGSTYAEVPNLTTCLEGASRPGHFRGVATVVLKLFLAVTPDRAYFGRKDYQQLLVIRRLVEDLLLPVEVRDHPTVREPDGLAMSSRNRYLSPDQRQKAGVLHHALVQARNAVLGGIHDADRVRQILHQTLESSEGVVVDYAEVADAQTLEPLDRLSERQAIALVAARLGATRLIDNMQLTE